MSSESIKEAEAYAREHCEDFIAELRKLRKRCMDYEQMLSAMEKGTCSVCQEPAKDELLEKLKSELKNKRLAIKNRNVRIRNLRNNLTGTQKALEKRNKELSEAKELLRRWFNLVGFKAEKLTRATEQFLKETEE